jgi:predicted nucleic acid-binding protein
LTRLREFLARHRRIAIDTSVFINNLEDYPRYADLAQAVFAWLERPGHSAVTSTLTFTELLVQPYRELSEDRVSSFLGLLSAYPNLEWVAPDLQIAGRAAQLRAAHRLRTPDALQAATAIVSGAPGFVTNDVVFRRLDALETLVLEGLL